MRPSFYLIDPELATRTVHLCDDCYAPDPLEGTRKKVEAPNRRKPRAYDSEIPRAFPTGGYIIEEPTKAKRQRPPETVQNGKGICGYGPCTTPVAGRRKYCSDAHKLRAHRRRHDPAVGTRQVGRPGVPLWLKLMDRAVRGKTMLMVYDPEKRESSPRFLKPHHREYAAWLAACALLNPNLKPKDRKQMIETASLTQGEIRRLKRRMTRIEQTILDYAHEHESAARKVSSRLEAAIARVSRETEQEEAV
jgi:Trp operon repressor